MNEHGINEHYQINKTDLEAEMEFPKISQQQKMINFVKVHGFITSLDGLKMGITDIAGQVNAMKKKGISWKGEWNDEGHFKKYYLEM